jgi:hypothetical protein
MSILIRAQRDTLLIMVAMMAGLSTVASTHLAAEDAIPIGSRLELLVDEALIETLRGGAALHPHRPQRREIAFVTDAPWEGNACDFGSVFRDGDLYRMYYNAGHYRTGGPATLALEDHPWFLCYAESTDGIRWRRPELGLHEFRGSKANNIILTDTAVAEVGGAPCFTSVLKDANPHCPAGEAYKIVMLGTKPRGLYLLASRDGVRFTLMSREPVVTEEPGAQPTAFDSQSVVFWDPVRAEYREYHRDWSGVRDIMTAASADIRHFPRPQWLRFPNAPREELYTNPILPYPRSPHLLVGFPVRYTDRGWLDSLYDLPGLPERLARASAGARYGTVITDAVFMTSRDGVTFRRWPEAFIRPGGRQRGTWVYGDNFTFWGLVDTAPPVEDALRELSLYATEGNWEGTQVSLRRYALRTDGFVSLSAPLAGGEAVTRPLLFDGGNLTLNAETSGAGGIQVEVQHVDGTPVPGFGLADCPEILCDSLCHTVRWRDNGGDLRSLARTPVRVRFVLRDADLYAFQFVPYAPAPARPAVPQAP